MQLFVKIAIGRSSAPVDGLCDTVSPPASWEPNNMVIRIGKIVMVAVIAVFMSIVAFDNVTDYGPARGGRPSAKPDLCPYYCACALDIRDVRMALRNTHSGIVSTRYRL
jgi:hypothetical protein